ncbi:shikimate dehydrogenase [Falsibacillus albus]|uniref:Shikimate dehydrogenase (NADP(+)) n=1 Tax=Falsibacillus albus TaxID=2478915 RepID=A0A3L7K773_9BACI|nr:shikimate dehydrogenase [Falsibacillus albus]RLQ98149.1 shikimate dehydrogenase [Falsibacillus albus]
MEKIYGVIGDPIQHSMSPIMHNTAFRELGLEAHYHAFHIRKESIRRYIDAVRLLNISGFNVTVPHKTEIMEHLDHIDPLANAIGAVNTVLNDNGRLIGYNTDGMGFVEAMQQEWKQDIVQENILIVGAGGASRAIFYTLASMGVQHIDIANRTKEKAQSLIENCPFTIQSSALSIEEAAGQLEKYSAVIQTTSIGMHPNTEEVPLKLDRLKAGTFVSDIIYNPLETLFLSQAKKKGAIIQNGVGMFVNQGAVAFNLWTKKNPNIQSMKNIVLDKLGGTHVNR